MPIDVYGDDDRFREPEARGYDAGLDYLVTIALAGGLTLGGLRYFPSAQRKLAATQLGKVISQGSKHVKSGLQTLFGGLSKVYSKSPHPSPSWGLQRPSDLTLTHEINTAIGVFRAKSGISGASVDEITRAVYNRATIDVPIAYGQMSPLTVGDILAGNGRNILEGAVGAAHVNDLVSQVGVLSKLPGFRQSLARQNINELTFWSKVPVGAFMAKEGTTAYSIRGGVRAMLEDIANVRFPFTQFKPFGTLIPDVSPAPAVTALGRRAAQAMSGADEALYASGNVIPLSSQQNKPGLTAGDAVSGYKIQGIKNEGMAKAVASRMGILKPPVGGTSGWFGKARTTRAMPQWQRSILNFGASLGLNAPPGPRQPSWYYSLLNYGKKAGVGPEWAGREGRIENIIKNLGAIAHGDKFQSVNPRGVEAAGITPEGAFLRNLLHRPTGMVNSAKDLTWFDRLMVGIGQPIKRPRLVAGEFTNEVVYGLSSRIGKRRHGIGLRSFGKSKITGRQVEYAANNGTDSLGDYLNFQAQRPLWLMSEMTGFNIKPGKDALSTLGQVGLKIALPAYGGYEALKYLEYKSRRILGVGPLTGAAWAYSTARVASQSVLDHIGITGIAKDIEEKYPGLIDSPASSGIRAGATALAGIWGARALSGSYQKMAAIAGGTVLGYMQLAGITKSASELSDEYTGKADVPIRSGRWWFLGRTPYQGGKIARFEPSWYRQMWDRPTTLGRWGSAQESWRGSWLPTPENMFLLKQAYDPYYLERCVEENTPIRMSDGGPRKAKDVEAGDRVYCADGKLHTVEAVWSQEINEEVVSIRTAYSGFATTTTPEHRYLVHRSVKCLGHSSRNTPCFPKDWLRCRGCRHEGRDINVGWVRADEITTLDFMVVPKPSVYAFGWVGQVSVPELDDYWNGHAWVSGRRIKINKTPKIDYDFGRFVGFYGSEGSSSTRHINMHLNIDETEYADWLSRYVLDAFGLTATQDFNVEHHQRTVHIYNSTLARWIRNTFGSGCKEKRLPEDFVWSPNLDMLRGFIVGYIQGDGCTVAYDTSVAVSSSNEPMLWQIQMILLRLGVLSTTNPDGNGNYQLWIHGEYAKLVRGWLNRDYKEPEHSRWFFEDDGYIYLRIKDIKREVKECKVVDIKVEGAHSFAGQMCVFHNTHYHDSPFPQTAGYGGDIPIIGPMVEGTVGRILKPVQRREVPVSASPSTPGPLAVSGLGWGQKGPPDTSLLSNRLDMMTGETLHRAFEWTGLPGFLVGAMRETVLGKEGWYLQQKALATSRSMASPTKDLYEMNFGGAWGLCIYPDTLVFTGRGKIPASEVVVGDTVLTASGKYQTITGVSSRTPTDEDRGIKITLKSIRTPDIKLTAQHEVLVYRPDRCRPKYTDIRLHPRKIYDRKEKPCLPDIRRTACSGCMYKQKPRAEYIPAGDVKPGDFMVYPRRLFDQRPDSNRYTIIDLKQFCDLTATDNYLYSRAGYDFARCYEMVEANPDLLSLDQGDMAISCGVQKEVAKEVKHSFSSKQVVVRYKRHVTITPEVAYLIGIYLAEGSKSGRGQAGIVLALHERETWIIDEANLGARQVGFSIDTIKTVAGSHGIQVRSSHHPFCYWLHALGNCYTKSVPSFLQDQHKAVAASCLRGLIDGDGHIGVTGEGLGVVQFTTTSEQLALDVGQMMLDAGVVPNIARVTTPTEHGVRFNIAVYSGAATELCEWIGRPTPCGRIDRSRKTHLVESDRILVRVSSVEDIDLPDCVYDFEVAGEHNFVAGFVVVHNSEFPRRFMPKGPNYLRYNPLPNDLPNWLPGERSVFSQDREAHQNFHRGSALDMIERAEMRLPGPGYDSVRSNNNPGMYSSFDRFQILCLTATCGIRMGDGTIKNVQNICVNDHVITEDGTPGTVTDVFTRTIDEDILRITMRYDTGSPLEITNEHGVLRKCGTDNEWVKANQLVPGDMCWLPDRKTELPPYVHVVDGVSVIDTNQIFQDWGLFWEDGIPRIAPVIQGTQSSIPARIPVDILAVLCGWYAAEGCVYRRKTKYPHAVSFTFNIHEDTYADEVIHILTALGAQPKVKRIQERHAIQITCYSSALAALLFILCGDKADKRVPEFILAGNDANKHAYITRYIAGDGWVGDYGKVKCTYASSVSRDLIYGIRDLLLPMGIVPSIRMFTRKPGIICGKQVRALKPGWRINFHCDPNSGVYTSKRGPLFAERGNGGWWVRIAKIEAVRYSGNVYNFCVDGQHTYCTATIVTHNSDIAPASQAYKHYKSAVEGQIEMGVLTEQQIKRFVQVQDQVAEQMKSRTAATAPRYAKDAFRNEEVTIQDTGLTTFTTHEHPGMRFHLAGVEGRTYALEAAGKDPSALKRRLADLRGQRISMTYGGYGPTTPAILGDVNAQAIDMGLGKKPIDDLDYRAKHGSNMFQRSYEWLVQNNLPGPLGYPKTKWFGEESPINEYKSFVRSGTWDTGWETPYQSYIKPWFNQAADIPSSTYLERNRLNEYLDNFKFAKYSRLSAQYAAIGQARSAAYFERQAEQTMVGLDPSSPDFFSNVGRSIPASERPYFAAFAGVTSERQQEEILSALPKGLQPVMLGVWGNRTGMGGFHSPVMQRYAEEAQDHYQVDAAQRVAQYFAHQRLPEGDAAAWSPAVDMDAIKVKMVDAEASDAYAMGVWPKQRARADMYNVDSPTEGLQVRMSKDELYRLFARHNIRNPSLFMGFPNSDHAFLFKRRNSETWHNFDRRARMQGAI